MVQRQITAWKKMAVTIIVLMAAIMLFGQAEHMQAAERARMEIEFEYLLSEDKTTVTPQAKVIRIDLNTGLPQTKIWSYPEKSEKLPQKAQFRSESDNSKTQTFWADFDNPRYFTSDRQTRIYVLSQIHVDEKEKPRNKVLQKEFIYEFNPTTGKLTMLDRSNVIASRQMITIFHDFEGYQVRRAQEEKETYTNRTTEIYSLASKKLLTRTSGKGHAQVYFSENQEPYLQVRDYITYKESASNPRENMTYAQIGNQKYEAVFRNYLQNGKKVDSSDVESPASFERKEYKAGKYSYFTYLDPATGLARLGYRIGTSNKIIPLTPSTSRSFAHFSPGNAYIVVSELPAKTVNGKQKFDLQNLWVFDAATAKLIRKIEKPLPKSKGWGVDAFYGDVVYINSNVSRFNSYLHLPTGTLSQVLPNANNTYENSGVLYGSKQGLLSLQPPPVTYVDDKMISFAGQGPFLTHDNRWYIEAGDFAQAIDATLVRSEKSITFTKGSKKLTVSVSDKEAVFHAGKAYIPLERLNESLGVVAAFTDYASTSDRYSYDVLRLFTEDLREDQVASDPEKHEFIEDFELIYNSYYEVENGKMVAKPTVGMQGYYSGNTTLIFKDGRLKNAYATIDRSILRNINLQRAADLDSIYGKSKVDKIGKYTLRWYEMNSYFLIFEYRSNTIRGVAYIAKS